jgi:hypothetical protein
MAMISILKVPSQYKKTADRHAGILEERKAENTGRSSAAIPQVGNTAGGSTGFASWFVRVCVAAVITAIVASVVVMVGSVVPASVLAMAHLMALAAILWLRHKRKKEVGSCR